MWRIGMPDPLVTLEGHRGNVYDLAWGAHEPHLLATAAADKRVIVWDTAAGHLLTVSRAWCAVAHHSSPRAPTAFCSRSPGEQEYTEHGHEVLACDWHKYLPGVLFSASVDCTVLGWRCR
jgi:WD40 repeat protein